MDNFATRGYLFLEKKKRSIAARFIRMAANCKLRSAKWQISLLQELHLNSTNFFDFFNFFNFFSGPIDFDLTMRIEKFTSE